MKTKHIILSLLAAASLSGCDKFLDREPDKSLTHEDVFRTKVEAERYLGNVYSFMPVYTYPGGWNNAGDGWPEISFATSDEAKLSYVRDYNIINNGAMNPANIPYNRYNRYYQGIREANIFIANIDQCKELVDSGVADQYRDEARFCRAYYYYMLMRQFGPVVLMYDEIIPESFKYTLPRNTWDECVEYVVGELELLGNPGTSFLLRDTGTGDKGRATLGAAMGLKAIVLLYSASPLFNPVDPANYIYKDVKNQDGTPLFPTRYDERKWERAAIAAEDVILSGLYALNAKITLSPSLGKDPAYYTRWNRDIIWGRNRGAATWAQNSMPRHFRPGWSWGGVGINQSMVDAYPMANGRYPIRLDGEKYRLVNGVPVPNIDDSSGYTEEGFTSGWSHPIDGQQVETPNMYIGREPRFYMNTLWSGQKVTWTAGDPKTTEYYYTGADGPGLSQDYSTTGYGNRKMTTRDFNINTSAGSYDMTWPYIRFAEILLVYAEARNECAPGDPLIVDRLNMVRDRWGVPGVDDAYPEINFSSPSSKEAMRELVKRERRVELYAEAGQRYFDVRRWMDAEDTLLDIYGMNVFAMNHNPVPTGQEYFWQRTLIERRTFEPKFYLYPFAQTEISYNTALVQNYGY
jgi:hypothetical protein